METKEKHLYRLSELSDYTVDSGYHDITKWPVRDLDGTHIGHVSNLLINRDLNKVVYVDVRVDDDIISNNHDPYAPNHYMSARNREFINEDGQTHIIIPVGLIDINSDDKYVYTETIDYRTFSETKRYNPEHHVTRDYEEAVMHSYDRKKPVTNDTQRDLDYERRTEIERTKAAYDHDEYVDDKYVEKSPQYTENEIARAERDRDRSYNKSAYKADRDYHNPDERLRNERESVTDRHFREKEQFNNPVSERDYHPEKTYDEDEKWERERPHFTRENRKTRDDDFYDRREFRDRY